MSDITVKDIKKAMQLLEENNKVATELVMSPEMKEKIIKMLNEQCINTKGSDGDDYVLGMRVIVDDRCEPNIAYVE